MKSYQNISASVRQRLLNRSKADNRSFNELLQYYAMERFLYRLSLSCHSQDYILKGALMLRVWNAPEFRPTMDIDMLGRTWNQEKNIISQIRNILAVTVDPDGLSFDPESILAEKITEDADYEGVRVRFRGFLGTARITIQMDIGFGDIVYPEPERAELPCMLDFPAPSLLCYSRESAIAEKFEAMIKLGHLNSRMKDFYDIWLLSRQFQFELSNLAEAVKLTFGQRRTELKHPIEAFSAHFGLSRQTMWTAFCKRLKQDHVPASFQGITAAVESFLDPVIKGVSDDIVWKPAGPWS
ncbi:nucleotidyl transferase AbiEii/AbiGii toxin family protein [Desulfobotulus sp. H1]|uniref:Nucleotidyl transferase AbiEii/AbiGii toxin family protein n=1 Tax=Desulfobotulus pelophilus TaxID=2823377 RepID=A0ABT3N7I9_9BACT|nr:nucleotidyl transferase AbiEii/AbiGii toxin family protein [Desulfobotulus pelophilus]MCW7753426.1 nucleotidyl transferase AbiEii/AbiGii toxin family protein [Desulfobotulus pelophilus]